MTEDQPEPPKDTVTKFPGTPWRYTPDLIVRTLFAQLDRLQDVVVYVKYKTSENPMILYSSELSTEAWLKLSAVAWEQGSKNLFLTDPDPETK